MAKTYAQLTKEIEALKGRAESVRKKEIAGVVSRIKEAISVYGLTAEDLGFGNRRGVSTSGRPKATRASKAPEGGAKTRSGVRYRDGDGNTWGGMGPRPGWLKAALAAGQSLESLAVKDAGERAVATAPKPTAKKLTVVAKYKDDAGHAWSGRGPKPRWVKDAMASGKTLDELAA